MMISLKKTAAAAVSLLFMGLFCSVISANSALPGEYADDTQTWLQLGCRYYINDPGTDHEVYTFTPIAAAHYKIHAVSSDGSSSPRVVVFDEYQEEVGTNLGSAADSDLTVVLSYDCPAYIVVVDEDGGNVHDAYLTVTLEDTILESVDITMTEPVVGAYAYTCSDPSVAPGSHCTVSMRSDWFYVMDHSPCIRFEEDKCYHCVVDITPEEGYVMGKYTVVRVNGREAFTNTYNMIDGTASFCVERYMVDQTYSAWFMPNGGLGMRSHIWSSPFEATLYEIAEEYPRDGYVFNYWICEAPEEYRGERAYAGDEFMVDDCYTFHAVWEKMPIVHFDMMGHGVQENDIQLMPGGTMGDLFPAALEADGIFVFDGWYLDEALTERYDPVDSINRDTTLYAKWVDSTTIPTSTPTGTPTSAPTGDPTSAPTAAPTSTPSGGGVSTEGYNLGDFVERLYSIALGRSSDAAGKQDWIDAVTLRGETGAGVARGFLYSPEFLNKNVTNEQFVRVLYRTFFNREADADGLAGWVAALERGDSKQEVIEGFINSTEWSNLCLLYGVRSGGTGTPSITVEPNADTIAFATRLYTTCLGRAADQAGLMAWARQLANQRDTGTGAARGFFFGTEFAGQRVTNEEFVARLYRTFMNREPDQAGYNSWVAQLNNGASRESVFDGFAQSTEFAGICAQYGIIR